MIPATGFLRLTQVLAIIPLSKTTWFEGVRAGRYPKPVKIGPRASAWRAEDIASLVERLGNPETSSNTRR
jgi:predicted DNA-binding transcriptional regulator AlpA